MCVCVCVCVARVHVRMCVYFEGGGAFVVAFFVGGRGRGREGEGQHTNFMELDMKRSSS